MSNENIIKIKPLTSTAIVPKYAHGTQDAACDLYADADMNIPPFSTELVFTGLAMSFPSNLVACVCSRSGLARDGVTVANAPGIVDSSYRGNIGVILHNDSETPFTIKRGDRIAQLMFLPVIHAQFDIVDELEDTDRGEGGFGSTGK